MTSAQFKKLCANVPRPKPEDSWPTAVCELSGPDLPSHPKVVFNKKYGVWFFTKWEYPLRFLDGWGDTLAAFNRMCRHLHYSVRWITPFPEDTNPSPGVH